MELTREKALELHRQMWSDMQRDLGDNPIFEKRVEYKHKWCEEHFSKGHIINNCFLCEYAEHISFTSGTMCNYCPIKWDFGFCFEGYHWKKSYRNMPISELLALPERKPTIVDKWYKKHFPLKIKGEKL